MMICFCSLIKCNFEKKSVQDEGKGEDDDEEGSEEVALDWWSKYFSSKDTQTRERKEAETDDEMLSDDENTNENTLDNNETKIEGKPRFKDLL